MTRRAFAPLLATLGVAAGACALAGCPSTTTTVGYTPITGILIRASSLVEGYGCGPGPGQVYRYAAVVSYQDTGDLVASEVFDCYADGLFSNLQPSPNGSLTFNVAIYAYDRASFPAALSPCGPSDIAGGTCVAEDAGAVEGMGATAPWTTACTATQQGGISVLAVCAPLTPNADAGLPGDGGGAADGAGEGAASDSGNDAGGGSDAADGGDGATVTDGSSEADATVADAGISEGGEAGD